MFVASYLEDVLGKAAVFTLATRDINRIATQSLLLGAHWQGLRNVVIVRGDPIRARDSGLVKSVNDYSTTGLISDIVRMNGGRDFRGLPLIDSTSLCPGATVDLSRGADQETSLAVRKVNAGAGFLLAQTHFRPYDLVKLQDTLSMIRNTEVPVFAGVQILDRDGIDFGNVPHQVRDDLHSGRSGPDIARELAFDLWSRGITTFYVIPTILPMGLRDYEAASDLIEYIKSLPTSRHATNR